MGTNTGHVMTLANSIIGVSVLAMPFCYKQCGIILASLMLILSSIMSRLACYYLLKSAIFARRRNFEFLAFHTFGPTGKLTVELSIIGFMLGTCVAFFVVVGDLGPAILGPILNIDNPASIRASVLIAIAVLVVLPLGLLRNVDSLAAISAITIAFYICLVLKVMGEATTNLLAGDWVDKVYYWRPAGLLQCIPIFSMALSCQTQLFEIFDSVPNASLDKMNQIVRSAVNMCTLMYMAMGFFGYIAFCSRPFSGNLMLSFSQTPTSEVIKMGFVLSVAVSFPLVIFPCRASLHSLLFRKGIPPHHELLSVSNHMPEGRFKCITLAIVTVSLTIGLLIPNIELVLGLVGSTIGVLICVIIPATLFLCLTTKNNNERLLAQVLFCMGVLIMVLGSYANLYATEEAITNNEPVQEKFIAAKPPELPAINLPLLPQDTKSKVEMKDEALKEIKNVDQLAAALPKLIDNKQTPAPVAVVAVEEKADVRKEPPIPEAPMVKIVSENPVEVKELEPKAAPVEDIQKAPAVEVVQPAEKKEEIVIHNDAIKKEDDEIKEIQKQEILKKKEELIEKLEENEQRQQKLLEEQKKILQDIKLEKEKLVQEDKKLELENVDKISSVDNKELKNDKVKYQNQENQVVVDKKENQPIDQANIKDNLPIQEPSPVKQVKSEPKAIVENVIPDDVVKKNMADGVPLPIAIQHLAGKVDGVKSAKIVENPENRNEGNADGKVLRREILGEGGIKEQREKRDIEEVINADSKLLNDANNERRTESSKVELADVEHKDENQLTYKKPVSEDVPLKGDSQQLLVNNITNEEKREDSLADDIEAKNKIPQNSEQNIKDQCVDKTKEVNRKFDDELKPPNSIKSQDVSAGAPENVQKNNDILIEKISAKEVIKREKTTEESIIKTPASLSNPGLILPESKIQLENIALNNEAKPMKRDLKSLQSQQEDRKESET